MLNDDKYNSTVIADTGKRTGLSIHSLLEHLPTSLTLKNNVSTPEPLLGCAHVAHNSMNKELYHVSFDTPTHNHFIVNVPFSTAPFTSADAYRRTFDGICHDDVHA